MERKWWKEEIAYQIYPRSFKDSNHDGIGDIQGIISKLDYLQELGVTLLWICPMYGSPMDDNGYDISDYYSIHPDYGTMEDMDELLIKAKEHGIKIIMDLVINHCSDEHIWFKKALEDPNSKYRNYFYFKEGKNHVPPCNWRGVFGGCVWSEIGDSNMFYYHTFSKRQPDLNWESQEMREDLYKMINWWLDKGIAGFRVDAINFIKKNLDFPSAEADGEDGLVLCAKYSVNQPGIDEMYQDLRHKAFDTHDCMTVCEAVGVPYDQLHTFIGDTGCFTMMFDFNYANIDVIDEQWFQPRNWTYKELKEGIFASQREISKVGWQAPFLENHDQPRAINKFLKERTFESITMLNGINLFLQGTPFIYQGEELGMPNNHRTSIEQFDDISTKNQYKRSLEEGFNEAEALQFCNNRSRDNARTPMPWTSEEYGGFSDHTPWLEMNETYKDINVEVEEKDEHSVLNFYKKMIALRKEYSDVFVYGDFVPVDSDDMSMIYKRTLDDTTITVIANFSNQEKELPVNYTSVLLSNTEVKDTLQPYQLLIVKS